MEEIKCIGCGVTLQTENRDEVGYVPKITEKESLICQRCYRLKHYNQMLPITKTSDEFLEILHKISERNALFVKIVDVFDFEGSWLAGTPRFLKGKDVLLIGNKVDLLPKAWKPLKIKQWMRSQCNAYGLKVKDVLLISSKTKQGVEEAVETILSIRKNRDVVILGATNVGKSTFVNQIIQTLSDSSQNWITTSHFPGTTLDVIEIPLDEKTAIFDTPGIVNEHQYAHYVDEKTLRMIMPKKEIKPIVNQLNARQSLFYGGLARVDFVKGERNSFISFLPAGMKIHRTKLEKADELYEKHVGELLQPPFSDTKDDLPAFVEHHFIIKENDTDLVISGLGFVNVKNKGATVVVHAPKGVGVYMRRSITRK